MAALPGNKLWAGSQSLPNLVDIIDATNGGIVGNFATLPQQPNIQGMHFDPNSNTVLTISSTGVVVERDPSDGSVVRAFDASGLPGNTFGITRGPGGNVFATRIGGGILQWNADGTFVGLATGALPGCGESALVFTEAPPPPPAATATLKASLDAGDPRDSVSLLPPIAETKRAVQHRHHSDSSSSSSSSSSTESSSSSDSDVNVNDLVTARIAHTSDDTVNIENVVATVSFVGTRDRIHFLGANFKDEDVSVTENDDGSYTVTIPRLWPQSELLLLFEAPDVLRARLEIVNFEGVEASESSNLISTLTRDFDRDLLIPPIA